MATTPDPSASEEAPKLLGGPPAGLPPPPPAPPTRVADRSEVRLERIDLARKRDRSRFLDVADLIQRGDPDYIAPLRMERMRFLDPAKNPAWEQLDVLPLLAMRGGRLAGRITAHVDRAYNSYHGAKTA